MIARFANFAVVVWVLVMSGCGAVSSPESKLIGKWEADLPGSLEPMPDNGDVASQLALGMVKQMLQAASVVVEFRADGKVVGKATFFGQTQEELGDWKFDRMEGEEMVIRVSDSKGKISTSHIKFIPDGTIRVRGGFGSDYVEQLKSVKMKRVS